VLEGIAGFAQGLMRELARSTGQRATVAEVTVGEPDLDAGETTAQPVVRNRRTDVEVAIEPAGSGDREQVEGGVKVTGSHRALLLSEQEVVKDRTHLLVTEGSLAGEYFRVVGAPDQPMQHHWEVQLELLTQENPVADGNLLADAFTTEFTEEFA
jgi:hypothetical protein